MSYQLIFENHPDFDVIVADGYGFKAPKAWGKVVSKKRCCGGNKPDAVFIDEIADWEIDPGYKVDQMIDESEAHQEAADVGVSRVVEELRREVHALDVKILTASGADAAAMYQSQRLLKMRALEAVKSQTKNESDNGRARIAKLKELRSRKRRDL